jgi:LCP family protein required for cell wall assembly
VSTLIVHVSAAGDHAVLVTVPPTALTDTPACRAGDGSVREPVTEPFAGALLDGGPSCLVRSVQQLSGLRIDHYLGLDLASVPGMVDALDGVAVCLPGGVTTDSAGLELPPGSSDLSGRQVTGYLSAGTTGADVTGTTAAEREQVVLGSTLRSALSAGTLANPLTLTRFLSRASDVFTIDADTTVGDVRALGTILDDLPADAVQRATVPVSRIGYVPVGTDRAAVLVDGTAARALFDAVIDKGRLPATQPSTAESGATGPSPADPGAAGNAAAAPLPAPALADPVPAGTTVTVPPAGVTVDVLDATGAGRGGPMAQALAGAGFRTGVVGTEPAAVDQTVIRYGPRSLEPARTVAAAVPGAVLTETDAVGGAVQLVLGPAEATVTPVAVGAPVPVEAAPAPAPVPAADAASCG